MTGIKSKKVRREVRRDGRVEGIVTRERFYIFLSSLSKMADLSRPSDAIALPRPRSALASPRLKPSAAAAGARAPARR